MVNMMETKWKHHVEQPYRPSEAPSIDFRVAHALEYIAAQLGGINAKLSLLIQQNEARATEPTNIPASD